MPLVLLYIYCNIAYTGQIPGRKPIEPMIGRPIGLGRLLDQVPISRSLLSQLPVLFTEVEGLSAGMVKKEMSRLVTSEEAAKGYVPQMPSC